jgi:peptide/nickel transport system ATP-binding protein
VVVAECAGERLRLPQPGADGLPGPVLLSQPGQGLGYILSRPLRNYQGLRAAIREKVTELLETVALTPASREVNRFAYVLSGGQRQRVMIARAWPSSRN